MKLSTHKPLWILIVSLCFILPLTKTAFAAGEDGADLYQQWCSSCHGDRGQGLTEEWQATWPETKQNCWQSKCHASNHPPDGFSFPKDVPALIGPETLINFDTGYTLNAYVQHSMPYWAPNLLSDEEYKAITAFLIKANHEARGFSQPTESQDILALSIHPIPEPEKVESNPNLTVWGIIFGAILLIGLALIIWQKKVRGF
ncbi:MAG: c-type cytochrome [Chloroflexota bacterium]